MSHSTYITHLDSHIHPELFVSMDNYVYPSDEEVIDIETEEQDSKAETASDTNDQSVQKVKTVRAKKKADEDTIKGSWQKERVPPPWGSSFM